MDIKQIEAIGKSHGLDYARLDTFKVFVKRRFPNEADEGYVSTWAQRFAKGLEINSMDLVSRGHYLKSVKDTMICYGGYTDVED